MTDLTQALEPEDWPRQAAALPRWIASVVRNLVRARARGDDRRTRRERDTPRLELEPAAAERVEQIELHRRVVDRVLALDEPYRTVMVLRFWEQRSLDEIARELQLPLETVKTRQKRALQRLRAELVGADGGEDRTRRLAALTLLAQGGAEVAMTIGAKYGIAAAGAGIAALLFVVWSLQNDRRVVDPVDAASAGFAAPASVEAGSAEIAPVAVRHAEPAPVATPAPSAPQPPALKGLRITGDVFDLLGRPLPGLMVEIYERSRRTGEASLLGTTRSDVRGEYAFPNQTFGRRTACLVVARDGPACTGSAFFPRDEQVVHLVLGATRALVGRVVDSQERPIEGAALVAAARNPVDGPGFNLPAELKEALMVRSAADGSFTLPGLPRGWTVSVDVERAGFASRRESFDLDDSEADFPAMIVLLPEVAVEGRVTFAGGDPAVGIRVGAQLQNRLLRMRNSWGAAVTGADGSYRIVGLEAGPWNVFVKLDEEQEREWCAAAGSGIDLTEAAPVGRADFVLDRGGELVVHVVDATTRQPIADEWVGIKSAAKSDTGAAINAIFSDEQGIARIRLPPGPVFPYLSRTTQLWMQQGGTLVAGETMELTVEIDVGLILRGVVYAPDGTPAVGAVVWSPRSSRLSHQANQTTAGEDGRFELSDLPRTPTWQLVAATAAGALAAPVLIDPATSDPQRIELRLLARPRTVVRGCVVDREGQPVAGAGVRALFEGGPAGLRDPDSPDPALQARSRADGSFELSGLTTCPGGSIHVSRIRTSAKTLEVDVATVELEPLVEDEPIDLGDLVLKPQEIGR